MGNLLYVIAIIMVIAWAVGFFVYGASSLIHILLVWLSLQFCSDFSALTERLSLAGNI
jgi:hypothetical protein